MTDAVQENFQGFIWRSIIIINDIRLACNLVRQCDIFEEFTDGHLYVNNLKVIAFTLSVILCQKQIVFHLNLNERLWICLWYNLQI